MRKIWYAVMNDREDNDWGTGSFNLDEAKTMLPDNDDAYIAVIEMHTDEDTVVFDSICIDEIFPSDHIRYDVYRDGKNWKHTGYESSLYGEYEDELGNIGYFN